MINIAKEKGEVDKAYETLGETRVDDLTSIQKLERK